MVSRYQHLHAYSTKDTFNTLQKAVLKAKKEHETFLDDENLSFVL